LAQKRSTSVECETAKADTSTVRDETDTFTHEVALMNLQEAQHHLQAAKEGMAFYLDEDEKVPPGKEAFYTALRDQAINAADWVLHYRTVAYMDRTGCFPEHFEAEMIRNHLEGERWAEGQLWGNGCRAEGLGGMCIADQER
jgi:hypothetical protein